MSDLSKLFKLFNNKEKKDKEKKVKTTEKTTKISDNKYYNKIREKFKKSKKTIKSTKIEKTEKVAKIANISTKNNSITKTSNSNPKKTNSTTKKTNSTTKKTNSTTKTTNSTTQTNNSTIKNNTVNSSTNNLNGWEKYNVSGDGNCAFHAIALYYEKNKKQNELKNIGINSANGKKLREKITERVKIDLQLYNQGYNKLNNHEKKIIKKIYTYNLINNNKNTITDHIKKSLEIFEKDCTYIDDHQLQIISAILAKKIFIWNAYQKYWHSIKFSDKFEIKDTIFLYFKNSHYQLLLPNKDYKFKNSTNNVPKNSVFKYDFLEKVK